MKIGVAGHAQHDAFGRPLTQQPSAPRTLVPTARPLRLDTDEVRTAALRSALAFRVGGWSTERLANLAGVYARRAGDWLSGARAFPAWLVSALPADERAAYYRALDGEGRRAA